MRAGVVVAGMIMMVTSASANEKALLVPSVVTVKGAAGSLRQAEKTDRTLSAALRERGYDVEIVRERSSVADASGLRRLLANEPAALVVAARIDGSRDSEVENDWTIAVHVLGRADDEQTVISRDCPKCVVGTAVQAGVVAALDEALRAKPAMVAAAPATPSAVPATPVGPAPPASAPELVAPSTLPLTRVAPRLSDGTSTSALEGVAAGAGVLVAGGIVMIGIGAKWLADDGKPSCKGVPANLCPTVYDTKSRGEGLLIPGALVTAGAAILMGIELHALVKRRRLEYSLTPAVGARQAGALLGSTW